MQRRLYSFIAIPALALGLAACGSSSKSSTPTATTPTTASAGSATSAPGASTDAGGTITISSAFTFTTTPAKAGSMVTVKNTSNATHTVTANDTAGGFDVTIDAGKTATFKAPAAGTYKFHCNIHNFMMGTLTVT